MKRSKLLLILSILFMAATVFFLQSFRFNSAEESTVANDKKWPSKRELTRKLWQTRKMLQVYGTGNPEFTAGYKKCAEESIGKNRFVEIIVKPDTAVTAEDIQSMPISLIGTPQSNLLLRKVVDALPVQFIKGNFSIDKIISSEHNDIFQIRSYPNPLNPSMPLFVTTGNNDRRVIEFVSHTNSD
ncbi:hypothetical protein IH799_08160 [candidate division KSB1 bacterium]|nr:hypothetical protein [candidate division KSB1 bacterium]